MLASSIKALTIERQEDALTPMVYTQLLGEEPQALSQITLNSDSELQSNLFQQAKKPPPKTAKKQQ